jgi:hypothetical protein
VHLDVLDGLSEPFADLAPATHRTCGGLEIEISERFELWLALVGLLGDDVLR